MLDIITPSTQDTTAYIQEERIAVVDAFEGAEKYPVSIYEQDLCEMARIIYEQLKKQVREGSYWRAARIEVAGLYKQEEE